MRRLRQVLRSRGSDTGDASQQSHVQQSHVVPNLWPTPVAVGLAALRDEPLPRYDPSARYNPDTIEREATNVLELEAPVPLIPIDADGSVDRRALCVMSNNINTGFLVKEELLKKCNEAGCLLCNLLLCATQTVSKATGRSIRIDLSNEWSPILRMQLFRPNVVDAVSSVLSGRWEIYQHTPDLELDTRFSFFALNHSVARPPPKIHIGEGVTWIGVRPNVLMEGQSRDTSLRARRWLSECVSKHTACQSLFDHNAVLPKRLIDVRHKDYLKLCETSTLKDFIASYATLSHCWGQEQVYMTQIKTLGARMTKMSWEEIPKTFQDAIEITRRLGLGYLWIDSLCIIQDDLEDWAQESSQMWHIYANSALTIAASAADSAAQGFLDKRPFPYVKLKEDIDGRSINVREDLHKKDYRKHNILATRGWVMQERLLSRRVLYFEEAEMKWECRTLQACECGSEDWSHITQPLSLTTAHTHMYTGISTAETYDWWRNVVVEHYSNLQLTRWTDRLPALSGLAALICAKTQDTYLAGVWLSDLPNGLLWETATWNRSDAEITSVVPPREKYHPSWSWIHMRWPVKHERLPLTKVFVSLNRFDIGLASVDSTGSISHGILDLSCPLYKGNWYRSITVIDTYLSCHEVMIDGPPLAVRLKTDVKTEITGFNLALIGERKARLDSQFNRVTFFGLVVGLKTTRDDSEPRHRIGHWRSTFTERADSPYDESFVMKHMTRFKLE